jgi:hypothetical protein
VNRLVTLATLQRSGQPIFSVDKGLMKSNLGGWANWPRLLFSRLWKMKKGAGTLRLFSNIYWLLCKNH